MTEVPRDASRLVGVAGVAVALLLTAFPAGAEEMDLQEANRQFANPLTRATLWITENNFVSLDGDITDGDDKTASILVLDPVIPISLGDSGWTLVTRPIVPFFIDAELPDFEQDTQPGVDFTQKSGIGDITYFAAFSPESKNKFAWGAGPIVRFPTAHNPELGAEKWSAGAMGVAVYSGNKLSFGALSQNLFSFAGKDDRADVRVSTLQYFIFYNFNSKWGVGTAPIISYDWETDDSKNDFAFPVGIGLTHTFRVGKAPSRMLLEYQKYVIDQETYGADWNVRLAWAVFLPKLGG